MDGKKTQTKKHAPEVQWLFKSKSFTIPNSVANCKNLHSSLLDSRGKGQAENSVLPKPGKETLTETRQGEYSLWRERCSLKELRGLKDDFPIRAKTRGKSFNSSRTDIA